MTTPVLVFDIETIPNIEAGRLIYQLGREYSNAEVAAHMFSEAEHKRGSHFLPVHLQQIAVISCLLRHNNQVHLFSLNSTETSEAEVLSRFFHGIDQYKPILVSWNGSGFDCPVLYYRALRHRISAPAFWDLGETDSTFKWNNYFSRYHFRHTDIMDVLSAYQPKNFVPLDELATSLGLPGKMGMAGDQVWPYYLEGKIQEIANYCETDVLNTYLVYCRFELMRGAIDQTTYEQYEQKLRAYLKEKNKAHLTQFDQAWTQLA